MSTIHVVIESWGEYDDAGQRMVKGFTDPVKAHHHAWELKEHDRRGQELGRAFNELMNPWRRERPHPSAQGIVKLPKAPNGLKKDKWPESYWAAKKEAERINALAYKAHEAVLETYYAAIELGSQNAFASIGCTDEERVEFFGDGPFYHLKQYNEHFYEVEELEIE